MKKVVIAYGDGIGPEIMDATLRLLMKAGARFETHVIDIGYNKYIKGYSYGMSKEDFETIYENKFLLKGPLITPQGDGYKSINVTIRKTFDLFANIRPIFVKEKNIDLTIVRENYEDLYNGIEYKFANTAFALKYISRFATTRIIRYAFELAKKLGKKSVTCFSKDNILKMTDGMFHDIFRSIAREYSDIRSSHLLVDIGSAELAKHPEKFDVIVTSNLYGDIISDIASHVSDSVGSAGSCNLGFEYAMFEGVHGVALDIAGKGTANPLGLINASLMMLEYLGQGNIASKIKSAIECTIADGFHTKDMESKKTKKVLSTEEFVDAIVDNLGRRKASRANFLLVPKKGKVPEQKSEKLVGIDVFIARKEIPEILEKCEGIHSRFVLHNITASGLQVWPANSIVSVLTDVVRLRFIGVEDDILFSETMELVSKLNDFVIRMTVLLTSCDGKANFSLSHAE